MRRMAWIYNPLVARPLAGVAGLLGVLIIVAGGGCSTDLVTGYQPRRLGDGPVERRAYYAPKFTPEAKAAEQEREALSRQRRPGLN